MSVIYNVIRGKLFPPKASTESFAGRTVLITATSGGLGLEAAKKLAAAGPSTLIVTARNEEKCSVVKKQIDDHLTSLGSDNTTKIVPMTLDMGSFATVQAFVTTLKGQVSHLDDVILNAGKIETSWVKSVDDFEEMIQVNAMSTLWLGILLLPLLLASPNVTNPSVNHRPHLNFVSSTYQRLLQVESFNAFFSSEQPIDTLSEKSAFPPGMLGGQTQYGRSKLLLEYGKRHLAELLQLRDAEGKPKVIVVSCCPGMVSTDLGRQYQFNIILKILITVSFALFARSAEQGCNAYLTALRQGEEANGGMWRDDTVLEGGPMIITEQGQEFGEKVWRQMKYIFSKEDSHVAEVLKA